MSKTSTLFQRESHKLHISERKKSHGTISSAEKKEKKVDRKSSFPLNSRSVIAFGNYRKTVTYVLFFYYLQASFWTFVFIFMLCLCMEIPLCQVQQKIILNWVLCTSVPDFNPVHPNIVTCVSARTVVSNKQCSFMKSTPQRRPL